MTHENDKTQLATTAVLAVSYSFFLDPSYFFMSVKINYLNFHEKDMTIFAEKKKKMRKEKKKKNR